LHSEIAVIGVGTRIACCIDKNASAFRHAVESVTTITTLCTARAIGVNLIHSL
jgi:hypothetical protein